MGSQSRRIASAAAGVLALLCVGRSARAQGADELVGRVASFAPGSIAGVVQDEQGAAIEGAVVSAVGSTSAFTVSDRGGRFVLPTLAPGPYLLRAHLTGLVAPRGQIIEVRPSARAASSIALHRVATSEPDPLRVLAAGLGVPATGPVPAAEPDGSVGTAGTGETVVDDDHSEVAWKLRHLRRGVLKDATLVDELLGDEAAARTGGFGQHGLFGRAAESSARFASSLFSSTPFSGQFNLLTSGSFDTPQQLFSTNGFARSIAYLALRAPVGEHADWTVRGALTQGDVSSWIVAAAYTTRAPARHRYDIGLSYSTQEYGTGSPAALRDGTSGSRSAGEVYGFDTFTITPAVSVTYGARVARYDYLDKPTLVSPRVALSLTPVESLRVNASVSHRAIAPGAEEFVPPVNSAIWLPPQRTFSSLASSRLESERTSHVEVEVERDVAGATLSVRTFRQHVTDQSATMFGLDIPGAVSTRLGHYLVANAGNVDTAGWSAGIRTPAARRVHGSVAYSQARARWNPGEDLAYMILLAPSAVRLESDYVRDLATTVETEVPETSTRVLLLYRVSNAFAATGERPAFDRRFDVQVRQSLPFMDFSSARWEMLLAVRNVFRESALDSSVYDELLVVRPPKRIVGGLALRF